MRALVISVLGGALASQAFAAPPPLPVEQNGWLVYQGSHVTQTAPCARQPIVLTGSHTDFTLTGACSYVRVTGEHNDVSIQIGPAATIEITGEHNDVTWQQVIPGPRPRLLSGPTSNTFHHAQD